MKMHPTLVHDPAMLYKMSVPSDVIESRATQKALKRLESKTQSSKVSGASTTNKLPQGGVPNKSVSFQDAVAFARKAVADQGIQKK